MLRLSRIVFATVVLCLFALLFIFGKIGSTSESSSFKFQNGGNSSHFCNIKGVWHLGWTKDAYATPNITEELMRLKSELAINYVGLAIPFFQDSLRSTEPHFDPNRAPSLFTLTSVIDQAHQLGLGVILLPYLLVESKHEEEGALVKDWVGELQPHDINEWFDDWRQILLPYAWLAEETKVEIFLIGYEFETLLASHKEWQKTITLLRHFYHGQLAYYTNWWANRKEYIRVLNWRPWRLLDFIGISAYFELTKEKNPTIEELKHAWYKDANGQNIVKDLSALSAKYNRCIVFMELGYRSLEGTNNAPWDHVHSAPSDENEQRDAFAAAFQVLSDLPWFAGYVAWGEQIGLPNSPGSYSVLDKEAEKIIKAHMLSPKACTHPKISTPSERYSLTP